MSKTPKAAEQPKSEQPKPVETLVEITNLVLAYRNSEKPTLAEVARITDRASGLLKLKDADTKMLVANAATIEVAKARNLVS
ncbi:hypothetical protein [Bradyrhizobium sp. AZCC 1708]|uniref:hypothetical protein n=1 Tax=Bradyrhizobium sp. AZCC 1708 TaxID=3117015 RepID=UPI002FF1F27C